MPIAQMAASPPITEPEPGAPIPRDAIDPDLVKLTRTRPKIGLVTAAGVVALCVYFLLRIGPDRAFSREEDAPRPVAIQDIAEGKIADDSYISVEAEPMVSHAIRTAESSGDLGNRIAPARGTGERVWLVLSGDGWEKPHLKPYVGRLRRIGDLKFGNVLDQHATANPRPTFATAAEVRAGFALGQVRTVAGDRIPVAPSDRVAFEVIDRGRATIVATFTGKRDPAEGDAGHGPLLDAKQWIAELARLGIPAVETTAPGKVDGILGQARFEAAMPVADVIAKLEGAKLWAARVEPVTHHFTTTWGALRSSPATGFTVDGKTFPDSYVDLIGLFVQRGIPHDSYAVLGNEKPADYWHIMPITVALILIGVLFAWALIRAVRDLLPARA